MRMRAGGRAFALGALLAVTAAGPASAACDDGTGCETTVQGVLAGQAATAEQNAEDAQVAAPDSKPLPLVNRKSSKPRAARTATKPAAEETRQTKTASEPPAPADKVKNARAEVHEADIRKDADLRKEADRMLTEAGRFPTLSQAQAQAMMPAMSPEEVNEIDAAAPQDAAPPAATPVTVVQQTAPSATKPADDMPRLATARVELPESTTVASAASQESTTWDKTSFIGKIFIALGGLLTAASAIRMFIG